MRRDIAILGLLYKVASGMAPPALSTLFRPASGGLETFGFNATRRFHSKALFDPVEPGHAAILRRSIFSMIKVSNHLPEEVVDCRNVKVFQRRLQRKAKAAASARRPEWQHMFRAGVYI